jgi:hypothetical protein
MITVVRHGVVAPESVETVSVPVDADTIEVLNRGSEDIYFTIDKSTPTVNGNNCEIVTAGTALEVTRKAAGNAVVKLVATGECAYSVRGVSRKTASGVAR